jgi:hypothetical protein
MNDVSLFNNLPASYHELLAQLEPEKNLTGGEFNSTSRISIRGGVFRKVVNGKEVAELEERKILTVVVKAAPISRMYFAGQYVAGESNPPTCWSSDTQTGRPAGEVIASDRQSAACFDCPQNIKGSGQGESRACRFRQRVAVMLADEDGNVTSNTVYQLDLPATSIFGDDLKRMAMQAYARYLNQNKTPLAAVLTEIRFDTNSSTPKLLFKPVRPLKEPELMLAINAQKDPETARLVKLVVKPKDKDDAPALPKANAAPAKPSPAPEKDMFSGAGDDAEEQAPEPKLRENKKKPAAPAPSADLASLLNEFDDD